MSIPCSARAAMQTQCGTQASSASMHEARFPQKELQQMTCGHHMCQRLKGAVDERIAAKRGVASASIASVPKSMREEILSAARWSRSRYTDTHHLPGKIQAFVARDQLL
mmetsp:Transcript_130475/g.254265  ORF Transcript_130475/g.254265 Transcript_130475/m.254265 type:complete len:109 (-) Transcript_130475:156-482(-)